MHQIDREVRVYVSTTGGRCSLTGTMVAKVPCSEAHHLATFHTSVDTSLTHDIRHHQIGTQQQKVVGLGDQGEALH